MGIALDLNLFADLVKSPDQPKTASELATNSGAEAALIGQAEVSSCRMPVLVKCSLLTTGSHRADHARPYRERLCERSRGGDIRIDAQNTSNDEHLLHRRNEALVRNNPAHLPAQRTQPTSHIPVSTGSRPQSNSPPSSKSTATKTQPQPLKPPSNSPPTPPTHSTPGWNSTPPQPTPSTPSWRADTRPAS